MLNYSDDSDSFLFTGNALVSCLNDACQLRMIHEEYEVHRPMGEGKAEGIAGAKA